MSRETNELGLLSWSSPVPGATALPRASPMPAERGPALACPSFATCADMCVIGLTQRCSFEILNPEDIKAEGPGRCALPRCTSAVLQHACAGYSMCVGVHVQVSQGTRTLLVVGGPPQKQGPPVVCPPHKTLVSAGRDGPDNTCSSTACQCLGRAAGSSLEPEPS